MTDLEALAKLATDAIEAIKGPPDNYHAGMAEWDAEEAFDAAASPDVVLALVRVALAVRHIGEAIDSDDGGEGTFWPAIDEAIAALADLDR
jgi:hypothetical protein